MDNVALTMNTYSASSSDILLRTLLLYERHLLGRWAVNNEAAIKRGRMNCMLVRWTLDIKVVVQ